MTQAGIVALSRDDGAPVGDVLLSRLYRAQPSEIPDLVDCLATRVRVGLAHYCYSRAHLRTIARVIASRCDDVDLIRYAGGAIGACLIDAKSIAAIDQPHGLQQTRAKVTLATKADMTRRFPATIDNDGDAHP